MAPPSELWRSWNRPFLPRESRSDAPATGGRRWSGAEHELNGGETRGRPPVPGSCARADARPALGDGGVLDSHATSAGVTPVCRRHVSSRRAYGGDNDADASEVRAQHAPPQTARRPLAGRASRRLRTAPNRDQPAGASGALAATRDDRDRGAGSRTRLASRTARRNRLT